MTNEETHKHFVDGALGWWNWEEVMTNWFDNRPQCLQDWQDLTEETVFTMERFIQGAP